MEILVKEKKEKKLLDEIELGTLPMPEKKQVSFEDVLVIILLEKNANFKNFIKPYELTICGRKMWEWLTIATDGYKYKTSTCTNETDILSLIKPLLEGQKYTVVLYSDTPLLKKSTFLEILDFFSMRNLNVLKLTRGYVFNTEYIKSATSIQSTQTRFFDEEDFIIAHDLKQLSLITEIMKNRILDFHLQNGIFIENPLTTFIDSDVVIESGVRIMTNNILRGKTIIGKNCLLEPSNYIENSIISAGCQIRQSSIIESKISEGMVVGPFEVVKKKAT